MSRTIPNTPTTRAKRKSLSAKSLQALSNVLENFYSPISPIDKIDTQKLLIFCPTGTIDKLGIDKYLIIFSGEKWGV